MRKILLVLLLLFFVGCDDPVEYRTDSIERNILGTWRLSVQYYDGYAIGYIGDNSVDLYYTFYKNGDFIAKGSLINLTITTWNYDNDTLTIDGIKKYYDIKFSSNLEVLFGTYTIGQQEVINKFYKQ